MSSRNPLPPKLYKAMLLDNYKQTKKDYQKIIEFQKRYHNPISQKEDRYIPPKTKGYILSQDYFQKMKEKPEKAHIKRIPLENNLTSGLVVMTEPNKPEGKKKGEYYKYHASSAQKRHLGKKIVEENYKKFYYDDFATVGMVKTFRDKNKPKNVRIKKYLIK